MPGARLLTERIAAPFSGGASVVNEDAGTVDNVGVCGLVSENGRDYPLDVQRRDVGKYDGAKVMFDHADEKTGRKFRDWVGVLRAPNVTATGSRARLELFKSDPSVPKLLEAIRKCPEKFGMSHVAMCRTKRVAGREVVEAIESVESVDIVLNPATNPGGFFRHESRGSAVKISLKQFAERFGPKWGPTKWAAVNKLAEDMGEMGDAPAIDAPPDDADTGDLKTALIAAITPMLDDAFESGSSDKACAALRDFVKLHAKHTGKAADDKPADPPADDAAEESKKAKPDPWAVLRECQEADYAASPAELETLALQPDPAKRAAFVREQKAKAANARAEKPQSQQRKPGAEAGKSVAEQKVPTDGKAFAAFIRG